MFKKPLAELKTSAPLRSSDRRKLKQQILQSFPVVALEEGDSLVPDGLLAQKFTTYLGEQGVAYLSAEGDPLWFTIGKNSEELIPTVYALWRKPDLLPCLSTPSAVVPKLVGGADLMIPGVIRSSPNLIEKQLVSVTQYHGRDKIGYPLAVGHMAVDGGVLEMEDAKGKAVYVLHTWKDFLWEMGTSKKTEVPEPRTVEIRTEGDAVKEGSDEGHENGETVHNEQERPNGVHPNESANQGDPPSSSQISPIAVAAEKLAASPPPEDKPAPLTAEDVSYCLREALLQAISSTLADLPPSSFPISASSFWTSHVLPARPTHVLGTYGLAQASAIDVKQSSHKTVKAFLKACAKEGLIKIKDAKGGDVQVVSVYPAHQAVAEHKSHRTIRDAELRAQKAEDKERKEKETEEKRKGEIQVVELWKPLGSTVAWIVAADKSSSELYTLLDLKTILNSYISSKQLVNAHDQQYINVAADEAFFSAVLTKSDAPGSIEFMKREEILGRLKANMQSWYEIGIGGQEPVRKKGQLKPIQVVMKIRQGRKACTLITGFEPFLVDAQDLADELRRVCASSTSVTPVVGKTSGVEVMVQGKQIIAVTDLLIEKGVPKKWIETLDMTVKSKKK